MESPIERLVIIGAGPAGLSAAFRSSLNPTLKPLVIAGPHIGGSLATEALMDQWPGALMGTSGYELASILSCQAARLGTRFVLDSVVAVEISNFPYRILLAGGDVIVANAIIIATGCEQNMLGFEHEQALMDRGIALAGSLSHYDQYRNVRVAVIGHTSAAADEALRLASVAKRVIVVCKGRKMLCNRMLTHRLMRMPNIEVMTNTTAKAYVPIDGAMGFRLRAIEVNAEAGPHSIKLDKVVLASALTPRTQMFGKIKRSAEGYIQTKHCGSCTNLRGIFAAGTAVQNTCKNLISVVASGYNAAVAAERFLPI
ncbi:MAG: NAD(P)/FAD-dependent oxidoreductase [Candidatus Hodgkinia cicadicola]